MFSPFRQHGESFHEVVWRRRWWWWWSSSSSLSSTTSSMRDDLNEWQTQPHDKYVHLISSRASLASMISAVLTPAPSIIYERIITKKKKNCQLRVARVDVVYEVYEVAFSITPHCEPADSEYRIDRFSMPRHGIEAELSAKLLPRRVCGFRQCLLYAVFPVTRPNPTRTRRKPAKPGKTVVGQSIERLIHTQIA